MASTSSPQAPADDDRDRLVDAPEEAPPAAADLSSLPVAGITRRRLAFIVAAFVSAWIVIVFARQVGEASTATAKVAAYHDANVELEGRVAALQREYELIQRQRWIIQQAHGYRLGQPGEIPFRLASAPPLPPNAPGSASVSLGADVETPSPLESWLSLLFGPTD
jgi:cell division protein FtsB